ncbi:MAG: putative porin [Bacteroidota bacterium]
MRRLFLLFVILQSSLGFLSAQNEETAAQSEPSPDTATVHFVKLNYRWPGEKLMPVVDTSLTDFQYFLPTESASGLNSINGNAGLAYKSMLFDPEPVQGFRFAPSVFNGYLLRNENIPFYHVRNPYSVVFYNTGKAKEQVFNVTHAQNLSRGITLGIDLRIINSLGLYERQKSDNSGFAGQGQFVSDNERYVLLANYRHNRLKWRENGGITYDSLFADNLESDRKRIPVNLTAADNQIKESGVFIRHFYYFGHTPAQADSVVTAADSLPEKMRPDSLHRYYNPVRTNFFRHTFSYTRNSLLYTDNYPVSGFYRDVFIDSTKTYDSVYYHEILNDLSFEGGVGKIRGQGKVLLLRIGVEYAFSVYRNDSVDEKYIRFTPYAYLSANAFCIAKAEGRIWATQGNPFNGDKGIFAKLTLPASDNSASWGNVSVSMAVDALQPDYLFQFHSSNHFKWENTFGQQTIFSAKSLYQRNYLKGGFNLYTLTNWVYLNGEAKPEREDNSFSVSQAWGQAAFRIGKFDIEAFGAWQGVSKSELLHLPEIAGRVTGCFNVTLFKRALQLRAGLSVLYNSAFYADAYMPALRSYYLQNSIKTGDYPYIDGFVNIRVKRARMYLILKHLNTGLSGYDYMMVPGYPMPDRGFRFGISWTFYD